MSLVERLHCIRDTQLVPCREAPLYTLDADSTIVNTSLPAECSNGDVRLIDGRNEYEGRLEVCQEGLWGFVCDDDWLPQENGIVVCQQLGFNATG